MAGGGEANTDVTSCYEGELGCEVCGFEGEGFGSDELAGEEAKGAGFEGGGFGEVGGHYG